MIMENNCPHCGSYSIVQMDPDYDWQDDDECVVVWDCKCDHDHDYIVSEIVKVTSRLVAKDHDDLERLIDEEDREYMAFKAKEKGEE